MTSTAVRLRSTLRDDLARRCFGLGAPAAGPERVGLEAELLPLAADTGRPVLLEDEEGPSSLELVRDLARDRGWSAERTSTGVPCFRTADDGIVSFEPGGQIEYSSAPRRSVDAVLDEVVGVVGPLASAARGRGIELRTRGIHPECPPGAARQVLTDRRYTRLARHLAGIAPAGRRMMLQTAALHVNLDLGSEPLLRWRVANALVPYTVALFANSARYDGEDTGYRSYRAQQWRELDPRRSGAFAGDDPVEEYLEFALEADAILVGEDGAPARPFRAWVGRDGVGTEAWRRHLTTLFPEVRPRGWLEVRCVDALPPRWYGAPLTFLTGIVCDAEACRTAAEMLPPVGADALETAGRAGVTAPDILRTASALFDLALEGAERLGPLVGERALRVAREFRSRYPARGRDPAGDREAGRI